jgi:prophage antirepressor-like protein
MNNITSHLFKIETVRVFETDDGNILFAGVDIAKCLGYVNTKQAIIDNVSAKNIQTLGEFKRSPAVTSAKNIQTLGEFKGYPAETPSKNIQTLGEFKGSPAETPSKLPSNQSNLRLINEYGLYEIIFSSQKDEAKEFRNWVFEEVLPSIRKTGTYSIQNLKTLRENATELNSNRVILTQANENKTDLVNFITVGVIVDELYHGKYKRGFKQRIGIIASKQLKPTNEVTVDAFTKGCSSIVITAKIYPISYKPLIVQIIKTEVKEKPGWILPIY